MSALCQDCLREVLVTPDQILAADWACWDGNHLCDKCGGDVCDCPGCMATLAHPKAISEVEAAAVVLWQSCRSAAGFSLVAAELRGMAKLARIKREVRAAEVAEFLSSCAMWLSMPDQLPAPSRWRLPGF